MLNIQEKIINNENINKHLNKLPLKFSEIEKFYFPKNKNELLIGLEYERLSLDKKTLKNAPYSKLERIIKHFCKQTNWNEIYDKGTLIGAISDNSSSISLEPGCQLEISLAPKKDILSIELQLSKISNLLDKIADIYDVILIGYGISPVDCVDEINLLQKDRYKIMDKYLPNCPKAELCQKMMRQSAGMQVNIDYFNNNDLYDKLKFFNLIAPCMTGLFANSPLENNKLSDKKSLRANIWRYTGADRCNFFYKHIFEATFPKKNIIKNYIKSILDVPMIFIQRESKNIEINGKITFRDFMKFGFCGYSATLDDYILHQSLCFPDVRLKKYIEIRNHDSSDIKTALALCAFYKGLCLCDLNRILSKLKFLNIKNCDEINEKIIDFGLEYKINNNFDCWDVIIILFNFAKEKLNTNDRIFLEPILDMVKRRKTKADVIIDYEINNAKDLIEFLY